MIITVILETEQGDDALLAGTFVVKTDRFVLSTPGRQIEVADGVIFPGEYGVFKLEARWSNTPPEFYPPGKETDNGHEPRAEEAPDSESGPVQVDPTS